MLQAGVSIQSIQDILGHADIMTTERYAHADINMKRKAMEQSDILSQDTKKEIISNNGDDTQDIIEWLKNFSKECIDKIK